MGKNIDNSELLNGDWEAVYSITHFENGERVKKGSEDNSSMNMMIDDSILYFVNTSYDPDRIIVKYGFRSDKDSLYIYEDDARPVHSAGYSFRDDSLCITSSNIHDGKKVELEIVYVKTAYDKAILKVTPLKPGIYYEKDNSGQMIGQYLINGYDTLHRVIYMNGNIISSEGQYIESVTQLKQNAREVKFSAHFIKIDSLFSLISIQQYSIKTERFESIYVSRIDTTYWEHIQPFDTDTIHIVIQILYGDDNGVVFERQTGFHTIVLGAKPSIFSIPEDSDLLKPKNQIVQ